MKEERRRKEMHLALLMVFQLLCQLMDFLYATITRIIFQFWSCRSLNTGESETGDADAGTEPGGVYLEADFTQRCHDDKYNQWMPVAWSAALVYVYMWGKYCEVDHLCVLSTGIFTCFRRYGSTAVCLSIWHIVRARRQIDAWMGIY